MSGAAPATLRQAPVSQAFRPPASSGPVSPMAKTDIASSPTKLSPGVSPRAASNPSLAAGQELTDAYKKLDPHTQQMLSSHPLVSGGFLSPEAAMNIIHFDKQPGEQMASAVGRTFAQESQNSLRPAATVGSTPAWAARRQRALAPTPSAAAPMSSATSFPTGH